MAILICTKIYGGCGYVGESASFGGTGDDVICPECYEDHCMQLSDENFDSLIEKNDLRREYARELLDKDHAMIHGGFLKFCVNENLINKDKLTDEQRKELGL